MAKSVAYADRGPTGDVSINMTPMIDVVFQLMIFFILSSQLASPEISQKIVLPKPHEEKIIPEREVKESRVVVNILAKEDDRNHGRDEKVMPGDLAHYEVSGLKISETEAAEKLKAIIEARSAAARKAGNKEFHVEVRADHRVAYEHVARALVAAGAAGVEKAYITVGRGGPADGE